MKVDKILETPEGTIQFQGELKGKELDAVITVGLHYLLSVGALVPLSEKDKKDLSPDVTYN